MPDAILEFINLAAVKRAHWRGQPETYKNKGGPTQSRLNLTNHHYKEPQPPYLGQKNQQWGENPNSAGVPTPRPRVLLKTALRTRSVVRTPFLDRPCSVLTQEDTEQTQCC